MQLKNTLEFLDKITALEIPISNTTRGEQIHQTYRNKLTTQLKEALYKDCVEIFANCENGIIPFLAKEGVILEIPNVSIADNTNPETCSGAISLEWSFTFKNLEFDAQMAADEYEFTLAKKARENADREKTKQEKIKRDKAAREARELKRQRLLDEVMKYKEEK